MVLTARHTSTLLYALLYLAPVKTVNAAYETLGEPAVSPADIRRFQQLTSNCPGHTVYRKVSCRFPQTGHDDE